jgi:hypothetical protein
MVGRGWGRASKSESWSAPVRSCESIMADTNKNSSGSGEYSKDVVAAGKRWANAPGVDMSSFRDNKNTENLFTIF